MCGSCQNRSHSTFGIVYKYSCIFIDLCILIVFVCNNCNVKLVYLQVHKGSTHHVVCNPLKDLKTFLYLIFCLNAPMTKSPLVSL